MTSKRLVRIAKGRDEGGTEKLSGFFLKKKGNTTIKIIFFNKKLF